jgi:hypothetical protein
MTTVVSTSTEPILLGPVSHKVLGVETDPTGSVVEAAFTADTDADPPADGDFKTATWETHTDGAGRETWWVKISIGPDATVGQLAEGHHQCWIRVTVSASEQPVKSAGILTVI